MTLPEDFLLYHGKNRQFSPGELARKKEKVKSAAAKAIKTPGGKPIKGQIPFGYKVENGRLVKEKKEQQVIRKIGTSEFLVAK